MWKLFISARVTIAAAMAAWMLLSGGCAGLGPGYELAPVQQQLTVPVVTSEDVYVPELRSGTAESYAQAVERLREGDVQEAERALTKLTRRQPELAGPWLNLGHVHLKQGDDEAAREAFMRALESNPQSCHAHTQLGVMLRRLGEFEAARGHYRSCLAAHPDFGVAHLNLGILSELYLGDLDAALSAYESYLEVTPDAEPRVKGWVADLRRRIGA